MLYPDRQDLKYGVIYIYFDPIRRYDSVQGFDIIRKIAYPFEIQLVKEADRGQDNTLLVARRFNMGNIGRNATVSLRLSDNNLHGVQFDALHKFRDKLFDVSAMDDGDIVIDEDDFASRHHRLGDLIDYCCDAAEPPLPSAAPQDKTRVEKKASRLLRKFKLDRMKTQPMIVGSSEEPDLIVEEESLEIRHMELERKHALEKIKKEIIAFIAQYHDDPKDLMQELLRGKVVVGKPGRVLVNGDMKIVLPEYDEMEIKMPAMCRALYILFMKYSKQGGGIVLKNIDEHRDEILDIYSLVKPGAKESRVRRTVDNLCDPFSESLNQMISRINRCVRNVITDKELAKQYIITGTKGEPYGIALDAEYMELPRAVIGE